MFSCEQRKKKGRKTEGVRLRRQAGHGNALAGTLSRHCAGGLHVGGDPRLAFLAALSPTASAASLCAAACLTMLS
eukprot:COSAG04_NODE_1987_length_5065_cov_8.528393_3_plen_75_part_00